MLCRHVYVIRIERGVQVFIRRLAFRTLGFSSWSLMPLLCRSTWKIQNQIKHYEVVTVRDEQITLRTFFRWNYAKGVLRLPEWIQNELFYSMNFGILIICIFSQLSGFYIFASFQNSNVLNNLLNLSQVMVRNANDVFGIYTPDRNYFVTDL